MTYSTLKPKIHPYDLEDMRFMKGALDMFSLRKSGNLDEYAYQTFSYAPPDNPIQGANHWKNLISSPENYYLFTEESEMIKRYAHEIGTLVPADAAVIDLGPGSSSAVQDKTLPFLNGLNTPARYIAIDINKNFAVDAAEMIGQKTNLETNAITGNFLESTPELNATQPIIFCLFGGLLCNGERDGKTSTRELMIQSFKDLKRNMQPGDYLIISQDANQDWDNLYSAYNHPDFERFTLSVVHQIKCQLPIENFNPDDFEYMIRWSPEDHLLAMGARVKVDCMPMFRLGGAPFILMPGMEFPIINSHKIPVGIFIDIAKAAGLTSKAVYRSPKNRTALHVLQVV